jgi:hypothetical protein
MNDFTKEELEHILKIMDHCYLDGYGQELGRKIQSIIDNYCEHVNTSCDCDCGSRCDDCGKCVAWNDKNDNQ